MFSSNRRTEQVRKLVEDLIAHVCSNRIDEAHSRFYAPDAVVVDAWRQEYGEADVPGQDREVDIGRNVTVHAAEATSVIVDGDRAAIAWRFVVSALRGVRMGEQVPIRQVTLQWWRGDRIVREETYLA